MTRKFSTAMLHRIECLARSNQRTTEPKRSAPQSVSVGDDRLKSCWLETFTQRLLLTSNLHPGRTIEVKYVHQAHGLREWIWRWRRLLKLDRSHDRCKYSTPLKLSRCSYHYWSTLVSINRSEKFFVRRPTTRSYLSRAPSVTEILHVRSQLALD